MNRTDTDRVGQRPERTPDHASAAPRVTVLLVATLAMLSAVSPLATDMYLPAFPDLTEDLGTTAPGVQLTLTAFMIGLGAGQLVIGSISDAVGRRRPLLIGTVVCLVASIVCALAPSITVLVIARLVQGFSGAAGVVLARAVITDLTEGARTVKLMNVMMIIGGIMPVLAPMIGGLTLQLVDWRGIFWLIVILVAVLVLAVATVIDESLPPSARRAGGLSAMGATVGAVLRNRTYVAAMAVAVLSFGTLFSYISASPFVIQNVLGQPTLVYSVLFGINALAMTTGSTISIRLADRVDVRRTLGFGVGGALVAALSLTALTSLGSPTVPVAAALMLTTFSMGFVFGNASAIAMQAAASAAGTGSAFMGSLQFTVGALVSPLVGIAGEADARPMALAMTLCAVGAALAYLRIRPGARSAALT